jgi:hypothetical protein
LGKFGVFKALLFQWKRTGRACSRAYPGFATIIHSHLKFAFHCQFTLQVKLSAPKVKPVDGCPTHLGKRLDKTSLCLTAKKPNEFF